MKKHKKMSIEEVEKKEKLDMLRTSALANFLDRGEGDFDVLDWLTKEEGKEYQRLKKEMQDENIYY